MNVNLDETMIKEVHRYNQEVQNNFEVDKGSDVVENCGGKEDISAKVPTVIETLLIKQNTHLQR